MSDFAPNSTSQQPKSCSPMRDLVDWETLAFDVHYQREQELRARIRELETERDHWKATARRSPRHTKGKTA